MAIDNAEKRRSIAGIHRGRGWAIGLTPNVSKDQEWRQQAGRGYSGILAGGALPNPSSDDSFTVRSMPIVFPSV
jgi:hypothetical protein